MATATDESTPKVPTITLPAETAAEQLDRAAERIRNRNRQLTFDVGQAGGEPDYASLKIAGDFGIRRDLKRRSEVHVVVTDSYGEVLVEGDATVTSVQFKDKTDAHGNVTTERIHVASLGA